jgi:hypothetical protein
MTPKENLNELVKKLRDAAIAQDPIARTIIQLVKLSTDEVKESLVSADGEDMYRLQGVARHLARLHRDLTTEPPSTTKARS